MRIQEAAQGPTLDREQETEELAGTSLRPTASDSTQPVSERLRSNSHPTLPIADVPQMRLCHFQGRGHRRAHRPSQLFEVRLDSASCQDG